MGRAGPRVWQWLCVGTGVVGDPHTFSVLLWRLKKVLKNISQKVYMFPNLFPFVDILSVTDFLCLFRGHTCASILPHFLLTQLAVCSTHCFVLYSFFTSYILKIISHQFKCLPQFFSDCTVFHYADIPNPKVYWTILLWRTFILFKIFDSLSNAVKTTFLVLCVTISRGLFHFWVPQTDQTVLLPSANFPLSTLKTNLNS